MPQFDLDQNALVLLTNIKNNFANYKKPECPLFSSFGDSHFSQSKIKIFAENLENNTLYLRPIDYVKYFIRIHSCRFKSIELDIKSFNPGFIFQSFDLILMSDFIQLDYFFEIFAENIYRGQSRSMACSALS